jgi:hypothetical protein
MAGGAESRLLLLIFSSLLILVTVSGSGIQGKCGMSGIQGHIFRLMAVKTNIPGVCNQQLVVLGFVGKMAGHTAAHRYGTVNIRSHVLIFLMAQKTDPISWHPQKVTGISIVTFITALAFIIRVLGKYSHHSSLFFPWGLLLLRLFPWFFLFLLGPGFGYTVKKNG